MSIVGAVSTPRVAPAGPHSSRSRLPCCHCHTGVARVSRNEGGSRHKEDEEGLRQGTS